jgi:hypothetical protein
MAFAITVDGHLAILADLKRNAILRRKRGRAGSRALGGGSPSASLEDAAKCRPKGEDHPEGAALHLWLPLPILNINGRFSGGVTRRGSQCRFANRR